MHAPLPFQMTVRCFGVWRVTCGLLCAAAATVTAIWAWRAMHSFPMWVLMSTLLVAAASTAMLWHAWGLKAQSIRWDGQVWRLGPAATAGHEPLAGRVEIAVDVGAWMMLRFVPEVPIPWRRGIWLPVQRASHEAAWHALRATVYCARPVTLPAAAPF
ncbi:MAG: hypothetical protein KF891_15100 [Rhizobacter sp.]|nr:hypothetical protein [Rhizobacter sp.]